MNGITLSTAAKILTVAFLCIVNMVEYVDQVMLPQLYDLATNYQPDIIWADGIE